MGCIASTARTMDHEQSYKKTDSGGVKNNTGSSIQYGVCAMQGRRDDMEDAHICQDNLQLPGHALFCVLDGHGGVEASQFCQDEFLDIFVNCEEWETYSQLVQQGKQSTAPKTTQPLLQKALIRSWVELDRELYLQNYYGEEPGACSAGTTAVTVLITPDFILCANIGDSRCVLGTSSSSAPTTITAQALSQDHKPHLEQEERRIQRAGGTVIRMDGEGRVDGELAVSRALGDFEFKDLDGLLLNDYDPTEEDEVEQLLQRAERQKVSAYPEIKIHHRDDSTDRFLVLACDGIWDVASNQDCAEWITEMLQQGQTDLGVVCEQVVDICLQQGSQDNMTIILVLLEGGNRLVARTTGCGGKSGKGKRGKKR